MTPGKNVHRRLRAEETATLRLDDVRWAPIGHAERGRSLRTTHQQRQLTAAAASPHLLVSHTCVMNT